MKSVLSSPNVPIFRLNHIFSSCSYLHFSYIYHQHFSGMKAAFIYLSFSSMLLVCLCSFFYICNSLRWICLSLIEVSVLNLIVISMSVFLMNDCWLTVITFGKEQFCDVFKCFLMEGECWLKYRCWLNTFAQVIFNQEYFKE